MADSPGPQQDGIVEVVVGLIAVSKALSRMEKEWDINSFFHTTFLEPEQNRYQINQWSPFFLLSYNVKASNKIRKVLFGGNTLLHIFHDGAIRKLAYGSPNHTRTIEAATRRRSLKIFDLFAKDTEKFSVTLFKRLAALALILKIKCKPKVYIADAISVE